MENAEENGRSYEFGPFRLDAEQRLLFRDGRPVPLAPKVAETLLVLVESGGSLVTKDELMRRLWPDTFVEESNLTQNIFTLRKALTESSIYIETVPRRGYRFAGEIRSGMGAGTDELIVTGENLWLQSLADGPPRRLTSFAGESIYGFDLSPDGKDLALARGNVFSDVVLISNFR